MDAAGKSVAIDGKHTKALADAMPSDRLRAIQLAAKYGHLLRAPDGGPAKVIRVLVDGQEFFLGIPAKTDNDRVIHLESGGTITLRELRERQLLKLGVEVQAVPNRRPTHALCGCGKCFEAPPRVCRFYICHDCDAKRRTCPGFEGPCPDSAVCSSSNAFSPSSVRARNGAPWMCKKCSPRKVYAAKTPEQRRNFSAAITPEQHSQRMREMLATLTPEQRRKRMRKASSARSHEQRSEATRKMNAERTPEQRSDIARRAVRSRRRKPLEIEFMGERMTIAEWAEQLGIKVNTIRHRLAKGWPVKVAMTAPVDAGNANSARRAALLGFHDQASRDNARRIMRDAK